VNNCIGVENHSYFYIYIILQNIYLVLVVVMAIFNIDEEITTESLASAKETCLIPRMVLSDPFVAQILYDISLIFSMMFSLFFTPFLTYLVWI